MMTTEEAGNSNAVWYNPAGESELKAYKKRWIVLLIYISYAAVNSFQWIEYSIITNIIMKYYNVSATAVNWTTILYMALYVPFLLPSLYIIDKKGLRIAALIGGVGTAIGTAIKLLALERNSFYVVLIGQAILAAVQIPILAIPPRLAAIWFKPNEVSSACALGVFGTQLGFAVGFVIPPMIIHNHENANDIGPELKMITWGLTIFMILSATAVVFYFPGQPEKPPSITQFEERRNKKVMTWVEFYSSIKTLLQNKPFMIHILAFGINLGVFSATGTLLNQFILQYFPNSEKDAGRMGLVMIIFGMLGSILCGVILDKTHKFKETTVFIYAISVVSVVGFIVAIELRSKTLVYIAIGLVGVFTNGYMPAAFELGTELTFPSPESTTTGILLAPSQVMGVVFTIIAGEVNENFGAFWSMASQLGLLLVGAVITAYIPNIKLRQEAFTKSSETQPLQVMH